MLATWLGRVCPVSSSGVRGLLHAHAHVQVPALPRGLERDAPLRVSRSAPAVRPLTRPRNPRFKDAHTGTKRCLDVKMNNRESGISGTALDAAQTCDDRSFVRSSNTFRLRCCAGAWQLAPLFTTISRYNVARGDSVGRATQHPLPLTRHFMWRRPRCRSSA